MLTERFEIEIPSHHVGENKDPDAFAVVKSLKPTTMDWTAFKHHLMSGLPYSFNIVERNSGKRDASGFKQAHHFALDSDRNATLAEILNPANPLARHICYIAPSPSDKPSYRKLRVIFQLATPIYDKTVLTAILQLFYDEFLRFGVRFDPACLDVTRWYYAKETKEIADFELNSLNVPAQDYCGIIRLPKSVGFDFTQCREYTGELATQPPKSTIEITDVEAFAELLEAELRHAGVLHERRNSNDGKIFATFKLTHCHTSQEHAKKDQKRGAYSHANITVWNDGGLTYHCYGGTCAKKGIHHFLRKFTIKDKRLARLIEQSTQRSNYTPQLLVPEKYPHRKVVNVRYLSDALSIHDTEERLILTDGPLGTGKTKVLSDYVAVCQEAGLNVLTVIPRRTLGTQAAIRFGVVDYQGETRDEMAICRSRVVCIPSLNKLVDKENGGSIPDYDVLLIDEPSKVLSFFTSASHGLFNPENPSTHALECFQVLREIGLKARKIVIAEACMDQRVAWLFRRIFDVSFSDGLVVKNEYQEGLPVTLWGVTDEIRKSPLYAQVEQFFAEHNRASETRNRFRDWMKHKLLSEAVRASGEANIPLIVACDEKENGAHGIRRFLTEEPSIPDDSILLVTSETKEFADVHAFLEDPNGFIQTRRPRVILHTAAMETGFSVEEKCGVVVVADSRNHTLDASAILQMIGRCRNPAFIHALLDERFRFENTEAQELIDHLVTNHKALEAKHTLNNQRLSADHAWMNEIHAQLTAESNRQRQRLIESVPAFLRKNGYDVNFLDPSQLFELGCDYESLVGADSLQTAKAVRNERIGRAESIIESTPISPDVANQHRQSLTVDEEIVAGFKKGQLLELTGAEWIGEEKIKDTLHLKAENAALFDFVSRTMFDETGNPTAIPTHWEIQQNDGYSKLKQNKGFIVSETFQKNREDISDEQWLSEVFVNNAVKALGLHKPQNQRRFDAFCDFHAERSTLVDWDIAELEGAHPFRAFKDPRAQIVDYTKRLIERIGQKSLDGAVWIRGPDFDRVCDIDASLKSPTVFNVDEYIRTQLDKASGIARSTVSELVRSYFGSTGRLMDNGDFLGVLRQVLYDYFYRVKTEYNTPIREEKLFSILPSICSTYEVKKTESLTYVVVDPQDCIEQVNRNRLMPDSEIKSISDCISFLNAMHIDGKPLGLAWFVTEDERNLIGVPCRVYRALAIDTALESKLLSLRAAPSGEEAAASSDLEHFRKQVLGVVSSQAAEAKRKTALDRIFPTLLVVDKPLSSRAIATAIGIDFSDANKKAITRKLNKLLQAGKIAKTGYNKNTAYFIIPDRHETVAGESPPFTSAPDPQKHKKGKPFRDKDSAVCGTDQSFLYKEDLFKNEDFVPEKSTDPEPTSEMEISGLATISTPIETECGLVFDKQTTHYERKTSDIWYVVNDSDIDDALSWIGEASIVGLDFETYADCGIEDPLYVLKALPRLLSISDGERTVVFDWACMNALPEKLRGWLAEKTIICHNAQFDVAFLLRWGIPPKGVIDTMIMESVVLGAKGGSTGKKLSDLCLKYLGETLSKTEQTADWSPAVALTDEMIRYSAKDASLLIPLHEKIHAAIASLGMDEQAYQIFCDAIPAVVETKRVGMPIDVEKTQELLTRLKTEADAIEQANVAEYGPYGYTTANSTKQIAAVIQRAFGVEVESTSRETLSQLALDTSNDGLKRFCEQVLSARRLMKIATELSKYTALAVNGRIHANYRLFGAISGRTSSSQPNLQQVSYGAAVDGVVEMGAIRRCFVARDGYQFVIADYAQVELVLNAIHCGDEGMLSAFRAGTDIHAHTASKIFGKPIHDVTKEERQIGKSANFGLQYGMGVAGFQRYAKSYGINLSAEEAAQIRRAWFDSYPQIATRHSQVKSQKPRQVRTITGRVMRAKTVPNALNLPIQGSGADLLNRAVAIIHEGLSPFDAAIVAYVHDELVVLVNAAEVEAVAGVVEQGMADAFADLYPDVPALLRSEVKIGSDWGIS